MIDVEYTYFIARRRNQVCRLAERTCLLITRNFMLHENTNDTNSCQNVAPVISFLFFFFFVQYTNQQSLYCCQLRPS